jgi:glycosyltransferase involved in cell wall biosynthesis
MLGRSRFVTATTHQLARETTPYLAAGRPIYVIPFGVDLERFSPRPQGPGNVVVLGFVKHLLPKYGPDVALEAFAIIHARRPATRLVMAGRGPMRDALLARTSELGLTHAVTLLGRVQHDQVPKLVQSFDLMLMPSIYESETFGVAAVEASACAVPVVASRIGGVPEAVLHDKTGLLVQPRDAQALAQACLELIDDPARRRALGAAGRRFVERHYVWQENARCMEEVYRAALSGADPVGVAQYQAGIVPVLDV